MNRSQRTAAQSDVSPLRRVNKSIDRLPAPIVLLAFFAAVTSALATGFGAVGALGVQPLDHEQAGVELLAGYTYDDGSEPCVEVLPFSLVVPATQTAVVKCIIVRNQSSDPLSGLTLIDTDLGDGPVWIEALDVGEQRSFSVTVASIGDLTSATTLTVDSHSLALEVESRTFIVESASIAGTVEIDQDLGEVMLTGRTQTGQLQNRRAEVGPTGRFAFEDLPPSDDRGYWVSYNQTPVAKRSVVVAEGDQVNITDEPLPLSVGAPADAEPEVVIASAPAALAFEPVSTETGRFFAIPLLILSGLIVALAVPVRGAPPVRQLPAPRR